MNALARAQSRYDYLSPEEDDGRADFINSMVEQLTDADDCRLVRFADFSESAGELLGYHSGAVVQLVLALHRGKTELANKIADRLGALLDEHAEEMVIGRMDK